MKTQPVRVFDRVGYLCEAKAGEEFATVVDTDGTYTNGLYFVYDGEIRVHSRNSTVTQDRISPYLSIENTSPLERGGFAIAEMVIDSKWFCLPKLPNGSIDPTTYVSRNYIKGKKLPEGKYMIFKGLVTLNDGTTLTGPKTLTVKGSDNCVVASKITALQFM